MPAPQTTRVRSPREKCTLANAEDLKLWREEGRMWVFIRPRGGQDYYLLMCENRVAVEFCPIHRFDGKHQDPKFCYISRMFSDGGGWQTDSGSCRNFRLYLNRAAFRPVTRVARVLGTNFVNLFGDARVRFRENGT